MFSGQVTTSSRKRAVGTLKATTRTPATTATGLVTIATSNNSHNRAEVLGEAAAAEVTVITEIRSATDCKARLDVHTMKSQMPLPT